MRRKKSFTLVELIMTIVVVAIMGIPLSLVVCQYINSFVVTENLTNAIQLVRLESEKVARMDYQDIDDDFFSQYEGFAYDIERLVSFRRGGASSTNSLKEIVIKAYPHGASTLLAECLTFRVKDVSF